MEFRFELGGIKAGVACQGTDWNWTEFRTK